MGMSNYLRIDTLPTKSALSNMTSSDLQDLLDQVDDCPHNRDRFSSRMNELAQNNPLWTIYRDLVVQTLAEKTCEEH